MTHIIKICLLTIVIGVFAHSATVNIIDIYRKEVFNIAVLKNRKPVLVYYTSSSCTLCQIVYKRLEELAKENSKSVYVAKVDFDKVPHLKEEFGIDKLPTTQAYVNGEIVNEVLGARWPAIKDALLELVALQQ